MYARVKPFGKLPLSRVYISLASGNVVPATTLNVLIKFALIVPKFSGVTQTILDSTSPNNLILKVFGVAGFVISSLEFIVNDFSNTSSLNSPIPN